MYTVVVYFPPAKKPHMKIIYEGYNWQIAKEKFNFWANEHRDDMDSIAIEKGKIR